jgi:hypothetical protein
VASGVLTDQTAAVVEEAPAPVVTKRPVPAVDDVDEPAPMLDFVDRRHGEDATRAAAYELEVRQAGGRELMRNFVTSRRQRP